MSKPMATLVETENVLVRLMTLSPMETGPRHFHTEIVEYVVCLSGKIAVAGENPAEAVTILCPGQSTVIHQGTTHRIRNVEDGDSQYLLTQSGGHYDFCEIPA